MNSEQREERPNPITAITDITFIPLSSARITHHSSLITHHQTHADGMNSSSA